MGRGGLIVLVDFPVKVNARCSGTRVFVPQSIEDYGCAVLLSIDWSISSLPFLARFSSDSSFDGEIGCRHLQYLRKWSDSSVR